jgi:hypothetical protein
MTLCDSVTSGRRVMPFVTLVASGMSKAFREVANPGTGGRLACSGLIGARVRRQAVPGDENSGLLLKDGHRAQLR